LTQALELYEGAAWAGHPIKDAGRRPRSRRRPYRPVLHPPRPGIGTRRRGAGARHRRRRGALPGTDAL